MGKGIPELVLHGFQTQDVSEEKLDMLEVIAQDFSPEFLYWVRQAAIEDVLMPCIKLLQEREGTSGIIETLHKLHNLISRNIGEITVVSGDLKRRPTSAFSALKKAFSEGKAKSQIQSNLPRQLGTYGHQLFEYFLTAPELRDPQVVHSNIPLGLEDRQLFFKFGPKALELTLPLSMRDLPFIPQRAAFDLRPELSRWENLDWHSLLLLPEQIKDNLREEISILWQALVPLATTVGIWMKNFQEANELWKRLNRLLLPVFRPFLWRMLCLPEKDLRDRYLKMLTSLTWANIAVNCYHSAHLFSELPLLPKKRNLRRIIDALQITKGNGEPLEKSELLRVMRAYAAKKRKPTAGKLLSHITEEETAEVIEVKFGVGDALYQWDVLDTDVLPLGMHEDQVSFYDTFASVDVWMARGRKGEVDWTKGTSSSRLIYCLPFHEGLIIFAEQMSPEEKMRYFGATASTWPEKKFQAYVRQATNVVARFVKEKEKRKTHLFPPQAKDQGLLPFPLRQAEFSFITEVKDMPELMEEARANGVRQWADEHKVVEITCWFGDTPQYELDLDRVSQLVAQGKIKVGRFRLPRGGHISCPIHNDPNPSMYLYMEEGRFHCFGCGAHGMIKGKFAYKGGIQAVPAAMSKRVKRPQSIEEIEVPGEHCVVMAVAQRFLHENFKGSAGERYIRKRRRLNPAHAYAAGIGFGTNAVALQILKALFCDSDSNSRKERLLESYEKLVFYGFIGFFESRNRFQGLVPLLRNQGLKVEDITEKLDADKKGFPFYNVPYFTLNDRVTAPLGFGDERIVNFYGRVVDERRKVKHFKCSTEHTGVPHGGFGMEQLHKAKKLGIAEGVMDSLALREIEMDLPAVALIGAGNTLLVDAIASDFQGDTIFIALDYDQETQTGQENTVKIEKRLRQKGFKGDIINFTAQFVEAHPEFLTKGGKGGKGCKDFNEWLQYIKAKK